MTGSDQDDEFEAYLQQRTVLPHHLAKSERIEPPPELDRIVLVRAREAIRTSDPAPVFRPARWALPFSLAATVVVAFAVILQMQPAMKPAAPAATRVATVKTALTDASQAKPKRAYAPSSPQPTADEMRRARVASANGVATEMESQSRQSGVALNRTVRVEQEKAEASRNPAPLFVNPQIETPVLMADRAPAGSTAEVPQDVNVANVPRPESAKVIQEEQAVAVSALLTPDQWREKIFALRAAGKMDEAQREAEAFHKAYPTLEKDPLK